jgi:hypothetical protein
MRFWITLLALAALSCSRSESPPPPSTTAEIETSSPATPDEQAAGPAATAQNAWGGPGLKLIRPGKAPLRKLRWTFRKGLKQTLEVKSELSAEGRVGGNVASKKPIQSLMHTVTIETKEITPDGSKATVEFVVTKADVAPELSEAHVVEDMQDAIVPVRGLRGRYSIDSRGIVDHVEIEVPPNVSFRTHQMIGTIERVLYQLTVPLPEEEVGEGAQWAVVNTIEQHGDRIDQRTAFEITKLEGSRMNTRTEVEQTAPRQHVTPKGAPDLTYELLYLESEGKGEAEWDLAKLVPKSAKSGVATKSTIQTRLPTGEFRQTEVWRDMTVTMDGK